MAQYNTELQTIQQADSLCYKLQQASAQYKDTINQIDSIPEASMAELAIQKIDSILDSNGSINQTKENIHAIRASLIAAKTHLLNYISEHEKQVGDLEIYAQACKMAHDKLETYKQKCQQAQLEKDQLIALQQQSKHDLICSNSELMEQQIKYQELKAALAQESEKFKQELQKQKVATISAEEKANDLANKVLNLTSNYAELINEQQSQLKSQSSTIAKLKSYQVDLEVNLEQIKIKLQQSQNAHTIVQNNLEALNTELKVYKEYYSLKTQILGCSIGAVSAIISNKATSVLGTISSGAIGTAVGTISAISTQCNLKNPFFKRKLKEKK